ncbi:MAG: hypothetical protein LBP59_10430 [Planctomycetaceae bacterium]|jgi:hypothetical protein|nr:hypothetical protein [Planctomycetaceae bacterium]
MLNYDLLIKSDLFGSWLSWDDVGGGRCVVRYGYNDVMRVMYYSDKVPFVSLSEVERLADSDLSVRLRNQYGYAAFKRAGLLKRGITELQFATDPEKTLDIKLKTSLQASHLMTVDVNVFNVCDEFVRMIDGGDYELRSNFIELRSGYLRDRQDFIDGMQDRLYSFVLVKRDAVDGQVESRRIASGQYYDDGVSELDAELSFKVELDVERLYYATMAALQLNNAMQQPELKSMLIPYVFNLPEELRAKVKANVEADNAID